MDNICSLDLRALGLVVLSRRLGEGVVELGGVIEVLLQKQWREFGFGVRRVWETGGILVDLGGVKTCDRLLILGKDTVYNSDHIRGDVLKQSWLEFIQGFKDVPSNHPCLVEQEISVVRVIGFSKG